MSCDTVAAPPRWVITGAASGMGLSLARGLAAEGCEIFAWDLHKPPAELAAHHTAIDLTDGEAIGAAAQRLPEGIDVFVHCAGGLFHADSDDPAAAALLLKATALHAGALISCAQAIGPRMKPSGAAIVAVTSVAQDLIYPRTLAYGPSKAALARVIAQLAVDLGPRGIRVNGVAPGAVRTPMTETIWSNPAHAGARLDSIPLRRPGSPDDIAAAIRFLASDAASYVTGCVLPVDGGLRLGLAGRLGT